VIGMVSVPMLVDDAAGCVSSEQAEK